MLIFDIFHFGPNTYEGNSNDYIWKLLQLFIPVGLVFLTYYFTRRHYTFQQKDAGKKEVERLSDVRMMLFYFLLRWRDGVVSQRVSFITAITSVDPLIEQKPNPLNNENVIEPTINIPAMNSDFLPFQIKRLELTDVFKILVSKSDRKEERQKMISTLYAYCENSIMLYEEVKNANLKIITVGEENDTRLNYLFKEMETMAQEFIKDNWPHDADISNVDKTLLKINQIQHDFFAQERTVKTKIEFFVNPIINLSNNIDDNLSPYLRKLHPFIDDYINQYIKVHYQLQTYYSTLKFWVEVFTNTLVAIDNVLEIEYSIEKDEILQSSTNL